MSTRGRPFKDDEDYIRVLTRRTLKRLYRSNVISQAEAGRAINVTKNYINMFLKKKRPLSYSKLLELREYLLQFDYIE